MDISRVQFCDYHNFAYFLEKATKHKTQFYRSPKKNRKLKEYICLYYKNKTDVILQLLVHPIWWGCEGVTASEKLQEFFENRTMGMSQKDKSYFDNELSKHLTVIRSGKLN